MENLNTNLHEIPSFYKDSRFIQPYKIFFSLNKSMPSVKIYRNIDTKMLIKTLHEEKLAENKKVVSSEFINGKGQYSWGNYLLIYQKNLFFFRDSGSHDSEEGVKIIYDQSTSADEINRLQEIILKFERTDSTNKIHLLINEPTYGLDFKSLPINKTEVDIHKNYNDDFLPVHEIILSKLSNDHKGIVLLHGLPGTGKTTYIRYLISILKKKIIFIPTDYSQHIASPEFITLLINNPNSILVIEDAENILTERNQSEGKAVSNLLNISDGILSDCLNIQIICTFNIDSKKIDPALLRKGRIIAKYRFEALDKEKAVKLANSLNINIAITQNTTLAEIYNHADPAFAEKETIVGFKSAFKN